MNLKCLKLDHNGLKTFPDLTHIKNLTHLFANFNRLSDYNDVEKLRGIMSLKELELINNPLSRR
jgi:Leucine-rich repeat (LRR) protein